MPASSAMSALASKIGNAHSKVKDEETTTGIQNIPPGIDNGIAQLSSCKFDKFKSGDNEGEYYFMAMGVILEPTKNNTGIPVKGLQTKCGPLPICETKKRDGTVVSLDENLSKVYNELRKLGLETKSLDPANLEAAVEALAKSKPYFRFSTSASPATPQYPNPRTWENWYGTGGLEEYDPDNNGGSESDDEDSVSDNTVDAPPVEANQPEETKNTSKESDDVESLLELANNMKADATDRAGAQDKLGNLAIEAGASPDEVENAPDWDTVAALITSSSESNEESESSQEDFVPEKGDVIFYEGKECEISAVFTKSQKVNVKDLDTKTSYKSIPWSELSTDG